MRNRNQKPEEHSTYARLVSVLCEEGSYIKHTAEDAKGDRAGNLNL